MELVATVRKDTKNVVILVFCETDDTPANGDGNGSGIRI
jgi:hypothetical protein